MENEKSTCLNIGEKIKEARERAGLSKKELAKKMGINSRQLWLWEKSTSNPSVETLERISEAIGCKLTLLLTEKGYSVIVLKNDQIK